MTQARVRLVHDGGHLRLSSAVDDNAARIILDGELDLHAVAPVVAEFDRLRGSGLRSVVIDASRLTFLDSSGLRALLTGHATFKASGTELQVINASPAVLRVLDMTGTRTLLEG